MKENVASILSEYSSFFNVGPFDSVSKESSENGRYTDVDRVVDIEETNPGAFKLVIKGGLQRFFAALEGSDVLERRQRPHLRPPPPQQQFSSPSSDEWNPGDN